MVRSEASVVTSKPLCVVAGLTVDYGGGPVVRDVSFTLRAGEVTVLLGPNGAGKSTTLNCLAGLVEPESGSLSVAGVTLVRGRDQPEYRRELAFVADEPALFDDLTVRQHAAFIAGTWGVTGWEPRLLELAEMFRLDERLDDMTGHFSRGMRQKTGLIMAFLHPASLYLLDEPFSGLDAAARNQLVGLLREACAAGSAALVSTHALGRVASLADRALRLDDGGITEIEDVNSLTVAAEDV